MLKHVTNLLKGQVTARVESGFPERVLNLCGEYGVRFWALEWESEVAFTFTLARRDWKRLRRITRNLDCRLQAVSWRGTPFFLGRLRLRYGVWIPLGALMAALLCSSFFIWDFEIEGNERVSDREILRALEKEGVTFGTFSLGFSSFDLRNDILLELKDLSYIAVNVRGSRAYVQVRERVYAPQLVSRRQPGNTVAAKDALVTAIQPLEGDKMVLPGTMVKTGQLLISGVVDRGYGGTRWLAGRGEVRGRTWYTLRCQVPLTVWEKTDTGEESSRYALIFGKKRINLYFNSSNPGDTCDKMITWNQCELPGGVVLPVTVVKETFRACSLAEKSRGEEEALAIAGQVLERRLLAYLEEGQVLSSQLTGEIVNGTLLVTLTAECEEQVGKFVEIPKE